MVWLPEPCPEETPDPEPLDDPELLDEPELLDDPELVEAELVPDEPLEPLAAEEVPPAVLAACVEPGRANATTPVPARPAAPTAAVTARSRACPRRLAAAAGRGSGSGEFIGFPFMVLTAWAPGVGESCENVLLLL